MDVQHAPRNGMSLTEMLIIIAIIGVLVAMLLPAVQRVREQADAVHCRHNIRQIGIAVHVYHDANGKFPNENASTRDTLLFVCILPFLEHIAHDLDAPDTVPSYLCPSRRKEGPYVDYASANTPLGPTSATDPPTASGFRSILGGQSTGVSSYMGTDLYQVGAADGSAHTIMLSHKALNPRIYRNQHPVRWGDPGWVKTYALWGGEPQGGSFNHQRFLQVYLDENSPVISRNAFGSPHSSFPALFADASVRGLRFHKDITSANGGIDGGAYMKWKCMWAWNDGVVVLVEDLVNAVND